MHRPELALDWFYISDESFLAVSITNVTDYDWAAGNIEFSLDGTAFTTSDAMKDISTTSGYKPVLPVWNNGWAVEDGTTVYVRVSGKDEISEVGFLVINHSFLDIPEAMSINVLSTENLSKYLDGIGLSFLWDKTKNYVDTSLEDVPQHLPIPIISADQEGSSYRLKVNSSYIGYGSVIIRYKRGADPGETDSEITQSGGTLVSQSGEYFVRAFPGVGNNNMPSGSFIIEI